MREMERETTQLSSLWEAKPNTAEVREMQWLSKSLKVLLFISLVGEWSQAQGLMCQIISTKAKLRH